MWDVIQTFGDERIVMHRRVTLEIALFHSHRYK